MKIESVEKFDDSYQIYFDDNSVRICRRFLKSASGRSIIGDEEVILALCDKLCPDE